MTRRVAVVALVGAALALGTSLWAQVQPSSGRLASLVDRTAIVEATNAARRRDGRFPLRENARLDRAAQIQADQLAATGLLEHELKGVAFPTPADRLKEAGYDWAAYGENIAEGQHDARDVVASWMKSPAHRTNILDAGFTEIGVGWTIDAMGRSHFAQVFGRPIAPARQP